MVHVRSPKRTGQRTVGLAAPRLPKTEMRLLEAEKNVYKYIIHTAYCIVGHRL